MLAAGTIVGKYRIEGARGRGGMGIVYEATELALDRRLALKVLREDLAVDPTFVERFRREGRIQASLDHPHIVPVYEAGESDHGLFLAMRLVPGTTLAELLRGDGLEPAKALRLLAQVAAALDAAHSAGLVHRDVKPQNVLVEEGDQAYLADFGLTKMGDGAVVTGTGAVTSTGPMLGTVAYLAPEVIRGDRAASASDRYAFAAMLFECLSGSVPFLRSSDVAVLYAHTSEPPPRVSERRPGLPSALDDVLRRGLAKDPASRQPTAGAMVDQATTAIRSLRLGALGARSRPASTAVPERSVSGSIATPVSRAAGGVPAALFFAALMAVAAFFLGRELAGVSAEPVPPVPAAAQPLGSDLTEPGVSLDCNGQRATAASPRCSVVQAELPGRTLVASRDGAIFSWAVRGARGELALQVFRERDGAFQVAKSQYEVASNESVHVFQTNVGVSAGDFIGVELADGASIGTRRVAGATTKRWLPPKRGSPASPPDLGPGSGLDAEILLRVDYFPGAEQRLPPQLVGAEAAAAPSGLERGREPLKFQDASVVEVVVVELEDRVVLDLFRRGQRVARVEVPDLRPGGEIVNLYTTAYDEPAGGETGIFWVNPSSARVIEHFFGVLPLEFNWFG